MQELVKQFDFHGNGVRVITNDQGQIFFVAKDVCDVLGYANSRKAIADNCKKEGVTTSYMPTESGNQNLTIITEGNLYRLVLKSKKKEAEKFESWVCDEVLPTIRKTGTYVVKPLTQSELILQSAQALVDHERRLTTMEQDVQQLKAVHDNALAQLSYLPMSDDEMPEETTRAKVTRLVNTYCRTMAVAQQEVWNHIYEKMYYVYRVSIKSYKKQRTNETWVEVAERCGHIDKMFTIISDLVKKSEPLTPSQK